MTAFSPAGISKTETIASGDNDAAYQFSFQIAARWVRRCQPPRPQHRGDRWIAPVHVDKRGAAKMVVDCGQALVENTTGVICEADHKEAK